MQEERFQGIFSKRYEGHRMRTKAISRIRRYVRGGVGVGLGPFNTANVP
jgi:hypothetical protein